MKIRRFVKKRRRRADQQLADLMSASHACRSDRNEIRAFREWLRRGGTPGTILAAKMRYFFS